MDRWEDSGSRTRRLRCVSRANARREGTVRLGPQGLEAIYVGLEKEHSYIVVSSGIRELGICLGVQIENRKEIRVASIALDVVIRRGLKPPLKHGPMVFIKRLA